MPSGQVPNTNNPPLRTAISSPSLGAAPQLPGVGPTQTTAQQPGVGAASQTVEAHVDQLITESRQSQDTNETNSISTMVEESTDETSGTGNQPVQPEQTVDVGPTGQDTEAQGLLATPKRLFNKALNHVRNKNNVTKKQGNEGREGEPSQD